MRASHFLLIYLNKHPENVVESVCSMRVSDSSLKRSGYERPCKLNKQGVPHVLSVSYAALLQLQSGGGGRVGVLGHVLRKMKRPFKILEI